MNFKFSSELSTHTHSYYFKQETLLIKLYYYYCSSEFYICIKELN